MKKISLFRLTPFLLTLALSTPILSAQVIVPLDSLADDMAVAYESGAAFQTGDQLSRLNIGNPNTLPAGQLGLLKFEIASFTGLTISNATLNLPIFDFWNESGSFPSQTIQVFAIGYELDGDPFVAADATTTNVTLIGSQTVTVGNVGSTVAFDLTSGFIAAQNAGFDYFAIRLENVTVLGHSGSPNFVQANLNPSLTVTAVPEPSAAAMVCLAFGLVVIFTKRRGSISA
jgi:hypothetical protein